MEILSGLIRISHLDNLPAPWYNRPPLGLETNTDVQVGVLQPSDSVDAPPDIVVTQLQLDRRHLTVNLEVDMRERAGALLEVLREIPPSFNVALTESVTIEARSGHRVTLVLEPDPCRPRDNNPPREEYLARVNDLVARLKQREFTVTDPKSEFVSEKNTTFVRQLDTKVDRGEIRCADIFSWIKSKYGHLADKFDFSKVVVSSNTGGRFVRYIFPRHGAFEIAIAHKDTPGALLAICEQLKALNYNILSSRLSRSTGNARTSVFVATCEPEDLAEWKEEDERTYGGKVCKKLMEQLDLIDPNFRVHLHRNRVSLGRTTKDAAYPKLDRVGVKAVYAHDEMDKHLGRHYHRLDGRRGVFFSHLDVGRLSSGGRILAETIQKSIRDSGALLFDGFSQPTPCLGTMDILARLWLSRAAVFLAFDHMEQGYMGSGQLVELGYANALGIPYVIVTKRGEENKADNFMVPRTTMLSFDNLPKALDGADMAVLRDDVKAWVAERIKVVV